jgi:hypothetical protein
MIAVWKYSFFHSRPVVDVVNDSPSVNETFLVDYRQPALKLNALRIEKEGDG